MTPKIVLLVGCPGSGKTWVANQLQDLYDHLPHDDYQDSIARYIKDISRLVRLSGIYNAGAEQPKPILIETPFSVSKIVGPLAELGLYPTCVYIVDNKALVEERYYRREGKTIPLGHLTRMDTYESRAQEQGAFYGPPDKVLAHLKAIAK
jgi:hypothetical protein